MTVNDMSIMNEYEVFDFGQAKLKLHISKEHRFGTDSLLLGDFAKSSAVNKTVVDLCSGCGIIPITLLPVRPKKIYAVEINKEAVKLLERSISENKISDKIEVIHGDLRLPETLDFSGNTESIDLVTANPPYFVRESGFERGEESQKIARYERECTLSDVVAAAAKLLKFGGVLKMCMTAPRLAECIAIMQKYKIEPKEIVFIRAKATDTARLFLISGKKGAKSGVIVKWR
ncbi:MAG: methyltransferase [Oscillospiraceae bacterium]|nr:methyltransferase [Oscillospiraceae bacterium]